MIAASDYSNVKLMRRERGTRLRLMRIDKFGRLYSVWHVCRYQLEREVGRGEKRIIKHAAYCVAANKLFGEFARGE